MGALIRTKRLAANPGAEIVDNAALVADSNAIAAAVVEHLIAAGLVTCTVIGTSATGGPVTGTATGSIT